MLLFSQLQKKCEFETVKKLSKHCLMTSHACRAGNRPRSPTVVLSLYLPVCPKQEIKSTN